MIYINKVDTVLSKGMKNVFLPIDTDFHHFV